ncbi:MAG: beta-propeller domain-containing protein [Phycisphaerae bacterium]|nr:beta-propeller domain-containing protein [Phycisphaerae bacterium]
MLTSRRQSVLAGSFSVISLFALAMVLAGCTATAPTPSASMPDDSGAAQEPDDSSQSIAREIEEADIVKFQDGYFYLANRWTGLRIIDARMIERPMMAGRAAMQGRAVELFVRDDHAFILSAADFFYCAGQPVGFMDNTSAAALTTPDYTGSRITVVDVSDKQQPVIVAEFDIDGFVSATRRVGDVIYASGNSFPESYLPHVDDETDTNGDIGTNGAVSTNGIAAKLGNLQANSNLPRAFVASVNIAEPASPYLVDEVLFFGDSFEINVSSQDAMFVAGVDPTLPDTTLVSYVDISDPQGDIRLRDQFRVLGVIRDRFFMDQCDSVFRIVTEEFAGVYPTVWTVSLFHYDVSDPDNITRLARLPLVSNQGMRSVRFDGLRAYAVTSNMSDPLLVLDLSDPADPVIAGEVYVLGYSTHLVPLGDRLINVGVDNSYPRRPSVMLIDVSDPHKPQPISRIVLGTRGDHISSEANFDEKAIQVMEDEQLILIPFSHYDDQTLGMVDGIQMIDLMPTRLRERGEVSHRGLVRRSGVADERLWILSDEAFKVVGIDDRDAPRDLAAIDIITDQELLDAGLWACKESARSQGDPWDLYGPDYYWGWGVLCGAGMPMAVMLTTLGLLGLVGVRRATPIAKRGPAQTTQSP